MTIKLPTEMVDLFETLLARFSVIKILSKGGE